MAPMPRRGTSTRSPGLREWVDGADAAPGDLDALAGPDEQAWAEQRQSYLLY